MIYPLPKKKVANKNRLRVICVIFNGNTPIIGINSHSKTNPNCFRIFDDGNSLVTMHAEYHALSKLQLFKVNTRKLRAFVFRKRSGDGSIGMARPCRFCQRHFMEAGVPFSNIYYTDDVGEFRRLSNDSLVGIDYSNIIDKYWEKVA